jgi:peptide/nickel transport system substrate-binding protein
MRRRLWVLTLVVICGACRGEGAPASAPAGTVVIHAFADPGTLFPPMVTGIEARQITELVYEYLADVGVGMNTIGDKGFENELASSWKWSADSMSIAFTIDSAARWHDSTKVTAHDVAFSFDVYTDSKVGSPAAEDIAGIDSVSVPDSSTAVFWFKRRSPLQFYVAAAQMLIIPAHIFEKISRDSLVEFASRRNPVGSGRYRFVKRTQDESVELQALPSHHRGKANIARLIWSIAPEYQSAAARLIGGDIDVFPSIRRETFPQIESSGRFRVVMLSGMDYAFMEFNLARPMFASRDVRRAITMSLDRKSIVQNIFDTLASVPIGPTVRSYPTTDTTLRSIPFIPGHAEGLLDAAGWKRAKAGGVRMKDGKPFQFHLLVPTSSQGRRSAAVLIQEQLRRAGIDVIIDEMDNNTMGDRLSKRDFDAALAAFTLGSGPSSVKSSWTSSAAGNDGLNYASYRNPVFDALVDSAMSASDTSMARQYYSRAYEVIIDDAPAVWLYEPRTAIAVERRLHTMPMKPSAWWQDIAHWTIDPKFALPRDNVLKQTN